MEDERVGVGSWRDPFVARSAAATSGDRPAAASVGRRIDPHRRRHGIRDDDDRGRAAVSSTSPSISPTPTRSGCIALTRESRARAGAARGRRVPDPPLVRDARGRQPALPRSRLRALARLRRPGRAARLGHDDLRDGVSLAVAARATASRRATSTTSQGAARSSRSASSTTSRSRPACRCRSATA